ncbi:hypothetical protein [Pseudomonas syringae]|uniref:Uncharacterized protein n=1 Tax=Pseudomonas syringae TaxID=317 RepID=A0A085VDB4_PSESX|nr:hypothetical protein [Pseudomonas syringae]KFE53427.1 hypothetical protein IV01_19930 [Pseudomonas syringae]
MTRNFLHARNGAIAGKAERQPGHSCRWLLNLWEILMFAPQAGVTTWDRLQAGRGQYIQSIFIV